MGSGAAVSPFGVVVGSQPMQGPNPHANYAFSPDDAGQLLTFSCAHPLGCSAVVLRASVCWPRVFGEARVEFQQVPRDAAATEGLRVA